MKSIFYVLSMVALLTPNIVLAQSTNASFVGLITDAKNEPIPGVSILIKNESTGFNTGTVTQADGRYQMRQLQLGGPYTMTVSFVGFATQTKSNLYLNQGTTVTSDFTMLEASVELKGIEVSANRFINEVRDFGASTQVNADQIKALPLEGRNFSGLVRLSPLQGNGAANIGGQRSGSTNITIDGANFRSPLWAGTTGNGPQQISQEAIREFEVVTNTYDVTEGRQGGGAVNAVTKFGTNKFQGTVFTYGWSDALASKNDIRGVSRTQDFSTYQWGFSLGGPIIKDKLHFFAAFDRQDQSSPVVISDIQTEDDEIRFGIRKDTLNKAINIARNIYGVAGTAQIGQFPRKTTANTAFLRFDWTLNDKHKITFRNNFTNFNNPINSGDNSNIVLRESYNTATAESYTGLVSLRSAFNANFTNEFKVQYQYEYTAQEASPELPGSNIPRAIVNVSSPFPTATNPNARTTRTFQFGGQRFTPEKTKYNQVHLINTSYLTAGKYNFTFGTDNYFTRLEDVFTSELNGRFFFNSLADLEAQKPSRYVREVFLGSGEPWVRYNVFDWSLFGQVDFNIGKNMNMVAGLRWDGTAFLTGAQYNEVADKKLGIKTNSKPSDFNNIQPRLQFTWNIGGKNTDILKIGGGAFSSTAIYYNQANNLLFDGLKIASIDVTTNIPKPDFKAFRENPDKSPGVPDGASYVSTINAMSPDFQIPMNWKANISYNKILFNERLRVGINILGTKTFDNYVYQERNLVDQPYFRLANEGNRGVFVPADKIATNGNLKWQDSRKAPELGRVLELSPDGILDQYALILDSELKIGKDGYFAASYTYNQTKDNSSYNCCVANTSTFLPVVDDPRALNYGYSDSQFEQKITLSGKTPSFYGFNVGVIIISEAGSPFTFHAYKAGTSLNGDFNEQNDLAFLFDPKAPTTAPDLAKSINDWFANPNVPQYAKDFYTENVGKIAPRNGGKNPFATTVDLKISKRFKTIKNQSLELTMDIFNFVNLVDKFSGRNTNLGREQRLLNIASFDPTLKQYKYTLNANTAVDPIGGIPWRIQLGARYSF